MKKLIREAHRRSLWQVLGIYLAGSWVALEVTAQIASTLALPEWVAPFAVVLLVIGFPIVMATAFVQEGMGGSSEPTARRDASAAVGGLEAAAATHGEPDGLPERAPAGTRRLLTWRNALGGGVLAFALLGLVTIGWIVARTLGIGAAGTLVAKGVLDEQTTILVTEFASPDSLLARAATEAFSIDFSDSRVVRVASPSTVKAALERMELEPGTVVDADVGMELAEREGIPAIVMGEITPAGSGYVLSARLVSALDGTVLVQQRQSAANDEEIIPAIDRLSKGMRERVGDRLLDIGSSAPLEQVTTADLEALRLYSQGAALRQREGPSERVEALMKEAIARDSAFATAWRGLAIVYQNRGEQPALAAAAIRRALDHQERLTRRERHLARATYFSHVTYEFDRSAVEYQALLDMDPRDYVALNNLAVDYTELREFERAEELFVQSLAADSGVVSFGNLVEIRANLGRFEGAQEVLDQMRKRYGGGPSEDWYSAHLAAVEGRFEDARGYLQNALGGGMGGSSLLSLANADLAALAATEGELEAASNYIEAARELNAQRGAAFNYLANSIQAAWVKVVVEDDPAGGIEIVGAALERFPLDSIAPLDRPYLSLAELYASAGDPTSARSMREGFERNVPAELQPGRRSEMLRADAAIALAEGKPEDAERLYRESDIGYCVLCALPGLARALEATGDRAAAIVAWRKYVDTPWFWRMFGNQYQQGPRLGPALETVARMYDEAGDPENAAVYYARFVELWADADPELQPRVEVARARLQEIVSERG